MTANGVGAASDFQHPGQVHGSSQAFNAWMSDRKSVELGEEACDSPDPCMSHALHCMSHALHCMSHVLQHVAESMSLKKPHCNMQM